MIGAARDHSAPTTSESPAEAGHGNDGGLELLEHVGRKAFGVRLSIQAGPKAINLIAFDTVDGHQRPTGTQPNKITTP